MAIYDFPCSYILLVPRNKLQEEPGETTRSRHYYDLVKNEPTRPPLQTRLDSPCANRPQRHLLRTVDHFFVFFVTKNFPHQGQGMPICCRPPYHSRQAASWSCSPAAMSAPPVSLNCPLSVSVPYGAMCCKNILIVPKPGHYNYGFPKFLAKLKRTPNMLRLRNAWGGGERGSAAH